MNAAKVEEARAKARAQVEAHGDTLVPYLTRIARNRLPQGLKDEAEDVARKGVPHAIDRAGGDWDPRREDVKQRCVRYVWGTVPYAPRFAQRLIELAKLPQAPDAPFERSPERSEELLDLFDAFGDWLRSEQGEKGYEWMRTVADKPVKEAAELGLTIDQAFALREAGMKRCQLVARSFLQEVDDVQEEERISKEAEILRGQIKALLRVVEKKKRRFFFF
jgi:hypothetical protein